MNFGRNFYLVLSWYPFLVFFCPILSCRMRYFLHLLVKIYLMHFFVNVFVCFIRFTVFFLLGDFPRLCSRHLSSTPSSFHYNWKRSSLNIIVFACVSELAFIKSSWECEREWVRVLSIKTLQINRLSLRNVFNFRIVSHPTHCIILISSFCCVLERISRRLTFLFFIMSLDDQTFFCFQ